MTQEESQQEIAAMCDEIKELLLSKNRAYGDSALNPLRVFSRASAVEQIKVRIDDKLSRMMRGKELPDESFTDTTRDMIGYLVLLLIADRRNGRPVPSTPEPDAWAEPGMWVVVDPPPYPSKQTDPVKLIERTAPQTWRGVYPGMITSNVTVILHGLDGPRRPATPEEVVRFEAELKRSEERSRD